MAGAFLRSNAGTDYGCNCGTHSKNGLVAAPLVTLGDDIRRTGGIFDSRRLGYVSTLCAVEVPNARVPVVAELIQGIDEITHNYLRDHPKYNMWFAFIASSQQRIESYNF